MLILVRDDMRNLAPALLLQCCQLRVSRLPSIANYNGGVILMVHGHRHARASLRRA